jgi:hypothetical protein
MMAVVATPCLARARNGERDGNQDQDDNHEIPLHFSLQGPESPQDTTGSLRIDKEFYHIPSNKRTRKEQAQQHEIIGLTVRNHPLRSTSMSKGSAFFDKSGYVLQIREAPGHETG